MRRSPRSRLRRRRPGRRRVVARGRDARRRSSTRARRRRPPSRRGLLHPHAGRSRAHTSRTSMSPATSTRRAATAAHRPRSTSRSARAASRSATAVEPTGSIEVWIGSSLQRHQPARRALPSSSGQHVADRLPPRQGRPPLHPDRRPDDEQPAEPGRRHDVRRRRQRQRGFPPDGTAPSTASSITQTIWALVDSEQRRRCPSQRRRSPSSSISRRRRRPDPATVSVVGRKPGAGHQLARASTPASITDLLGYQILCNRGGDLQVFSDGTLRPRLPELRAPTRASGRSTRRSTAASRA